VCYLIITFICSLKFLQRFQSVISCGASRAALHVKYNKNFQNYANVTGGKDSGRGAISVPPVVMSQMRLSLTISKIIQMMNLPTTVGRGSV
jgi:hypothetical protein